MGYVITEYHNRAVNVDYTTISPKPESDNHKYVWIIAPKTLSNTHRERPR